MSEPIRVEMRGNVALWTIDRPDRSNSLSRETLLGFGRLARAAAADASVRAIVITGAGDKAFCAGADLKERQGMSENDVRRQVELYRSELGPLDRSTKPVIAAINGVAYGGGLELALVCDLRVGAAHAKLALPETSLGIIPGAGGTQRLARAVGKSRAMEMILTGKFVSAREAEAHGLVSRVVPVELYLEEAKKVAGEIASKPPVAVRFAKEAINKVYELPLAEGLDYESRLFYMLFSTEDQKEGMSAFLEKRKALWKGK